MAVPPNPQYAWAWACTGGGRGSPWWRALVGCDGRARRAVLCRRPRAGRVVRYVCCPGGGGAPKAAAAAKRAHEVLTAGRSSSVLPSAERAAAAQPAARPAAAGVIHRYLIINHDAQIRARLLDDGDVMWCMPPASACCISHANAYHALGRPYLNLLHRVLHCRPRRARCKVKPLAAPGVPPEQA